MRKRWWAGVERRVGQKTDYGNMGETVQGLGPDRFSFLGFGLGFLVE